MAMCGVGNIMANVEQENRPTSKQNKRLKTTNKKTTTKNNKNHTTKSSKQQETKQEQKTNKKQTKTNKQKTQSSSMYRHGTTFVQNIVPILAIPVQFPWFLLSPRTSAPLAREDILTPQLITRPLTRRSFVHRHPFF